MSYKPLGGCRKFLAACALTAFMGAAVVEPPKNYADELVTGDKVLTLFGDTYNVLVKENGNEFEYEDRADLNGDGKPDKITFKLGEGFVTKVDNSGIVEGQRLDVKIDLGDGWVRKIYGIVDKNGKVSICKSLDLGIEAEDAGQYLNVWLQQHK